MTIFAGTSVKTAGYESLSIVARKVEHQIWINALAILDHEKSTIEIFDNGSVREDLIFDMNGTAVEIELIDGRLTKFATKSNNGWYNYSEPAWALNMWIVKNDNFTMAEHEATLKFDEQAIEAQIWDQKQEEIDYLYHMMWDTDNYDFPPAAWERLANLEK